MAPTKQQLEVINSKSKRILVLSCAGSGKTSVISKRIVRLCSEGADPASILALTFGSKAAGEMSDRICRELPGIGAKVHVKTFHAYGYELIKKYNIAMGFNPGKIRIATANERTEALKESLRKSGLGELYGSGIEHSFYRIKSFADSEPNKVTCRAFEIYQEFMREKNLIDMDDMIYIPTVFLENNPNALAQIQEQYKYIFVDEYQDTNEGQNRMLDLLTADDTHLCIVGDDDQAIYEWRGAKPKYILDKADSGEYEVLKLEKNFRSQKLIIDIADTVINHNKTRVAKAIKHFRDEGAKPVYMRFEDQEDEARQIAGNIKDLIDNGKYGASDIAILCRTNDQKRYFSHYLDALGIPSDTCELDENAQYSKFLNVLHSILDFSSLKDVSNALNFPDICFNKAFFEDAKNAYCDEYGQDCNFETLEWLDRLYLSDVRFENCNTFRERYALISQMNKASASWTPTQIIALFISYMENRKYNEDYPDKYHFVLQVFDMAKFYEERYPERSLLGFIENLEETICKNEPVGNVTLEAVNLITMHSAKGKEYKAVFLPGIQAGMMPLDSLVRSDYDLETERRLFYVAITRAKDFLAFSSFEDPFGATGNSDYVHHGFMAEIPDYSYTNVDKFKDYVLTLPDRDTADIQKPIAKVIDEVIEETVKTVEPIGDEPETAQQAAAEPETVTEGISAPEGSKPASLSDIPEDKADKYLELMMALSQEYELPSDRFVVMVGGTDVKQKVIPAIFKNNGIPNYEAFGYDGSGFNLSKYMNNPRCIGIILGPQAHKMDGVEQSNSLKGKILEAPEAFPFMVDLIDRHITKSSLQEALAKIKWNYSRTSA